MTLHAHKVLGLVAFVRVLHLDLDIAIGQSLARFGVLEFDRDVVRLLHLHRHLHLHRLHVLFHARDLEGCLHAIYHFLMGDIPLMAAMLHLHGTVIHGGERGDRGCEGEECCDQNGHFFHVTNSPFD